MRYPARHLCTLSVLFAYGLIAIGGDGLHVLYHDCSGSEHASHVEAVVSHDCCHAHAASGATRSHTVAADDTRDSGQDAPKPSHRHDEDSCLLCQHLAQAQAEVSDPVVVSIAEPIAEPLAAESGMRPIEQPAEYDCRGPPVA